MIRRRYSAIQEDTSKRRFVGSTSARSWVLERIFREENISNEFSLLSTLLILDGLID